MDALDELIGRSKIQQLVSRYAFAVDGKDLDGVAELFVEDVDNGRYGTGREGVKNFYDHVFRASHCSVHFVGNHVIDFDDARHARGVVYCLGFAQPVDSDEWTESTLAYWDSYERHGDDWLFRRRDLRQWSRRAVVHAAPPGGDDDDGVNATAGRRLPEFFPHYAEFWDRSPRTIPDGPERSAQATDATTGGS